MKTKLSQTAAMTGRRGERGRRGTSLIEVMVVLVILLIGVFSVIRVFPIGFLVLRQGENRTLANRLATQMQDQIKADSVNLPDGVLFSYDTTGNGTLSVVRTEDPEDLSAAKPTPNAAENPYFTDVNKFRFIAGEAVKVPLPTVTDFGAGSIHILRFGPIYMSPEVGNPENVPGSDDIGKFNSFLRVYGPSLIGIPYEYQSGDDANAASRLRGPQTYLIDYGDDGEPAWIMFYPRRPRDANNPASRSFRMAFSYDLKPEDPTSGEQTRIVNLTVPDSDLPVWQPIVDAGGVQYKELFYGSEVVSREFNRIQKPLNANPDWDPNDPYEYALVFNNIAGNANLGVIAFNPAGATYTERTPYGQQPFTAYVDYSVLDWHIIREDREVPSILTGRNGTPIKLTLSFIKKFGDVEPDQTTYQGLYNDPRNPVDIQVIDLQTGRELAVQALDFGTGQRDTTKDVWLNTDERGGSYRTGTLYLNSNLAGRQIRVLYKADGDWAMTVQKAFSTYDLAYEEPLDRITARSLPTAHDNYGIDQARTRLYFNRTELNKSVVLTLQYTKEDDSNGNADVVRTAPLQLTIDKLDTEILVGDPIRRDADGNPIKVPGYAYIDLADPNKNLMSGRNTSLPWSVYGRVAGTSLKVRVIWRDNASESNVWRTQDLETYLTRPAGS